MDEVKGGDTSDITNDNWVTGSIKGYQQYESHVTNWFILTKTR